MFRPWTSQRHAGVRAGFVPGERDTALAVVLKRNGETPLLQHCGVHPVIEIKPEHVLGAMIPGRSLARTPVSGVITSPDYRLVQVEAPEVPAAEIRAAVRWKLRDAIDFPVEEAVVDVFSLPEPSRHAQTKMLVAVAARSSAVQRLVSLVAHRARSFDVIDVPELCLRNLATLLPQDERGVAFVVFGEGFAQLLLTRQGTLYLTRRIELGRRHDIDFTETATGAGTGTDINASTLALEIQRSLDYYESHYDLPAITDLVLAPADTQARAVASALQAETSLNVELFEVERLFTLADGLEIDTGWRGLLALGAALRTDSTGS